MREMEWNECGVKEQKRVPTEEREAEHSNKERFK